MTVLHPQDEEPLARFSGVFKSTRQQVCLAGATSKQLSYTAACCTWHLIIRHGIHHGVLLPRCLEHADRAATGVHTTGSHFEELGTAVDAAVVRLSTVKVLWASRSGIFLSCETARFSCVPDLITSAAVLCDDTIL